MIHSLSNETDSQSAVSTCSADDVTPHDVITTAGGDYAAGGIDKRQGVFIGDGAIVPGTIIGVNQGTVIITPEPEIEPPAEPARPLQAANFVGRTSELDYYSERLTTDHLAVITGMAGVGKTALAAELALRSTGSEHIFWHAFHEDEGIDSIITKLAGFLSWHDQPELWRTLKIAEKTGGKIPPREEIFDNLIQMMRGKGFLLCLDNFQFVDQDPLLDRFIERLRVELRTGTIALILTSRQPPKFVSAMAFKRLGGLSISDTGSLMAARGAPLADTLVADLQKVVEGNVMLLTLASGLLQNMADPAKLIDRLFQTQDIVNYLMNQVRKQLTEDENAVMSAVAVLLGSPSTRDAIEAILDRGGTWDALHALHNRDLLMLIEHVADQVETTGVDGYIQHAIVREFYYDTVLGKRDRQAMHRRAALYYQDRDNGELDLLKAARHFQRAGDNAQCADLATKDVSMLFTRGEARPLRELLERLDTSQLNSDQSIAVATTRGRVYLLQRESELAEASFKAALAGLAALPDAPAVRTRKADICSWMGELLRHAHPAEALSWLHDGLAGLAGTDASSINQVGRIEAARLHLTIGAVLNDQGEYPEAIAELEQCLLLVQADVSQLRGFALMNLGNSYLYLGDYQRAEDNYRQAKAIYQQFHNHWRITTIQLNLALVMETTGKWAAAATEYNKTLVISERLGIIADHTLSELNLGNLCIKQGDTDAALAHLMRCIELARKHTLTGYLVAGLSTLTDLYSRLGQWESAKPVLADAERMAQQAGATYALPEIYRGWAQFRLAHAEGPAALTDAERAIKVAHDLEDPREEGMSLRIYARALFDSGNDEQAREAFGQSLALLANRDPYEAARTRAAWGEALLHSPDTAQGKLLVEEARATFAELGALREIAYVEQVLAALTP